MVSAGEPWVVPSSTPGSARASVRTASKPGVDRGMRRVGLATLSAPFGSRLCIDPRPQHPELADGLPQPFEEVGGSLATENPLRVESRPARAHAADYSAPPGGPFHTICWLAQFCRSRELELAARPRRGGTGRPGLHCDSPPAFRGPDFPIARKENLTREVRAATGKAVSASVHLACNSSPYAQKPASLHGRMKVGAEAGTRALGRARRGDGQVPEQRLRARASESERWCGSGDSNPDGLAATSS